MTSHQPPAAGRRGPRALVVSGVVVLVLAVAAGVVAAVFFARALPLDVLAADGGDGDVVVGSVAVPGEGSVPLEADSYALWLAAPGDVEEGDLVGDVDVLGPDGEVVRTSGTGVDGTVGRGGVTAVVVGGFTARTSGTYALTVDGPAPDGARVLVVPDEGAVGIVTNVFGTLGFVFLGLLLGATGIGLLIGGLVAQHRRRQQSHPPRPTGPPPR